MTGATVVACLTGAVFTDLAAWLMGGMLETRDGALTYGASAGYGISSNSTQSRSPRLWSVRRTTLREHVVLL